MSTLVFFVAIAVALVLAYYAGYAIREVYDTLKDRGKAELKCSRAVDHQWRFVAHPFVRQCAKCGLVRYNSDYMPDGLQEYVDAMQSPDGYARYSGKFDSKAARAPWIVDRAPSDSQNKNKRGHNN